VKTAELVASLGRRLGHDLALDGKGCCCFRADGIVVTIADIPDVGAILLSADLGGWPPDHPEALYEAMISAQYRFQGTAGGSFSINPENGRFEFCRPLAVKLLDADSFYELVETFVTSVETWATIIREYRGEDDARDRELPDLDPFKVMWA